jgi:hypothetical protein
MEPLLRGATRRMQNKPGTIPSPTIELNQQPGLASNPSSQPSATKQSNTATTPPKKTVKSLLKGVIKKKDNKVKDSKSPSESKATPEETATPAPATPALTNGSIAATTATIPSAPATSETSKKRSAPTPAPALGVLGGYDSDDSDDSAADAGEPEAKKVKL